MREKIPSPAKESQHSTSIPLIDASMLSGVQHSESRYEEEKVPEPETHEVQSGTKEPSGDDGWESYGTTEVIGVTSPPEQPLAEIVEEKSPCKDESP